MKLIKIIPAVSVLVASFWAVGATAQSIELPPSSLFETSTSSGRIMCGRVSNRWVPGVLKKDGETFTTFANVIKKLKADKKKAKTEAKKAQIQKKIDGASKKKKAGASKCAAGPGGTTPTPTPGGGNPTPTPTSNLCWNGDTVSGGCFGIPSSMTGSLNRGTGLYSSLSCMGCHGPSGKNNRTVSQIQASFSQVPSMAGLPMPNLQQLVDLTAYSQRFNISAVKP